MAQDKNYTYDVKKIADGDIKIEVQVNEVGYKVAAERAYEKLKGNVKLPGFRAGNAPRSMIESKLGIELVQEAIDILANELGVDILEGENIDPITKIEYQLEKAKDDKGVAFSYTFAVYPEVKLADITKITVEKPSEEVSEDDIDDVVYRLFIDKYKEENNDQEKAEDTKSKKAEDKGELRDSVLKWVNDEKVQDLAYEDVKNVVELRNYIKDQLKGMKEREALEQFQNEALGAVVKASKFDLPKRLNQRYVESKENEYRGRISELGIELDVFLKAQNTSIEKLRENWTKEAEMRYSGEIVLTEIAKKYELIPTTEDIENELASIQDPKLKSEYDSYDGKRYIASVLLQRKALEKLLSEVKTKAPEKKAKTEKAAK